MREFSIARLLRARWRVYRVKQSEAYIWRIEEAYQVGDNVHWKIDTTDISSKELAEHAANKLIQLTAKSVLI